MRNKSQWFLMVILAALLVASIWYCLQIWRTTPAMPPYGNVVMSLVALVMVVFGSGLIALMYFSGREGLDETARMSRRSRKWRPARDPTPGPSFVSKERNMSLADAPFELAAIRTITATGDMVRTQPGWPSASWKPPVWIQVRQYAKSQPSNARAP